MKLLLSTMLVWVSLGVCPSGAQGYHSETADELIEESLSDEPYSDAVLTVLVSLELHLSELVEEMQKIQDAETVAAHGSSVMERMTKIQEMDWSVFAQEDTDRITADLHEIVTSLKRELIRLHEQHFYGDSSLQDYFRPYLPDAETGEKGEPLLPIGA